MSAKLPFVFREDRFWRPKVGSPYRVQLIKDSRMPGPFVAKPLHGHYPPPWVKSRTLGLEVCGRGVSTDGEGQIVIGDEECRTCQGLDLPHFRHMELANVSQSRMYFFTTAAVLSLKIVVAWMLSRHNLQALSNHEHDTGCDLFGENKVLCVELVGPGYPHLRVSDGGVPSIWARENREPLDLPSLFH